MSKMCNECFEIYSDFYEYNVCAKCNCVCGDIVYIDDLLQSTIQILNKKLFTTLYCCSAHTYDKTSSCYIKFDDEVDLPNIPNGFSYDNEDFTIIRKKIKSKSILGRHKEICENSIILLEWASSLPKNPLKNIDI